MNTKKHSSDSSASFVYACGRICSMSFNTGDRAITVNLQKSSANQDIPRIQWDLNFQILIEVIPLYSCKKLFTKHLHPLASELFHLGSRNKTCGCVPIQSNMCYIHSPYHPPVRSTVQIMKLLVTMFYSMNVTAICIWNGK